jgi:SagB-type dehydrogenase family enzyme
MTASELRRFDDQTPADPEPWEVFHEASKVSASDPGFTAENVLARMDELWESYPYVGTPRVALPRPATLTIDLDAALTRRATARPSLVRRPLELAELSAVLLRSYGVTRSNEGTVFPRPFRVVPSGGGLYPIEIYCQANSVTGLTPGLYHFNPTRADLALVRRGDASRQIAEALVQRDLAVGASVFLFLTAVFERSTFKYGDRGYRFALIEAGHIAQNALLVAGALGYDAIPIGGFFDRVVDEFLGCDGVDRSSVYLVAIGEQADDAIPDSITR